MDWETIVSHVAHEQPALVIDRSRRVRFVNAAMQGLLGWGADELAARGWLSTCILPRDRASVQQVVVDALNGSAAEGKLRVVTRDGRRLAMRVGFSRQANGRGWALVVVAHAVGQAGDAPVRSWDLSCDISRAPDTLGIVRAVRFLDPSRDSSTYVGQPLGAMLAELGCTAVESASSALLDPCRGELVHVALPESAHAFCVVTAQALGDTEVRVTVRHVDMGLLPAIVEAKIKRVADEGGLSDRERQVLQLLLRGRGLEDIATMLEIAPRTVKFHQANVLQKLGAESRLDLLRVVL